MTGPEGNSEFCFPRFIKRFIKWFVIKWFIKWFVSDIAEQMGQAGGKQIIKLLTNDVQQRSTFRG